MSIRNEDNPGKNKATGKHEDRLPQEISNADKRNAEKAHNAAEKDMDNDVDFSSHSPNDDLDEGESARSGEDLSNII